MILFGVVAAAASLWDSNVSTYYHNGGDWEDLTKWWSNSDGTGQHPHEVPWVGSNTLSYNLHATAYAISSNAVTTITNLVGGSPVNNLAVCDIPNLTIDDINGEVASGTFSGSVNNLGIISNGTFTGSVTSSGSIDYATFSGTVANDGIINSGSFSGANLYNSWIIYSGSFTGSGLDNHGTIYGGNYSGSVITNNGAISGGSFTNTTFNYASGSISAGTWGGSTFYRSGGTNPSGGSYWPNWPAYGTSLGNYCVGYDYYSTNADGLGGNYGALVETNSVSCGYTP